MRSEVKYRTEGTHHHRVMDVFIEGERVLTVDYPGVSNDSGQRENAANTLLAHILIALHRIAAALEAKDGA